MYDNPFQQVCELGADSPELRHLMGLLPVQDLSQLAHSQGLSPTVGQATDTDTDPMTPLEPCEAIAQVLFRSQPGNVLLTGRKGVGKTTWVRELARRAAVGDFPFLRNWRFLWIDCRDVGAEDSRACLESIFTAVAPLPDLVLCLDGLGSLLKRPAGGSNKPLLRALIRRPGLRLVGVMSDWEYNDLIGGDAEMLDEFARIEVAEPDEAAALAIVQEHAARLGREFGLRIDASVVERVVGLASTFVLSECHPVKSVSLLRRACETTDYVRTQIGHQQAEITLDDVVRAIAEKTGIPAETIAGENETCDFESALRDAVVGQDQAVAEVANELRLIRAGLSEPGKPATVMLFAGMTGVGKTELAKRIAELYSTSRRLQVYTMANFTEPHSVSGIIGVPPGYVGHEQGGRLINDLNADPYSVFLLDEAEKCHPNIWKPFLNLFDEGWIVDQRGLKAYADRAIFILTTNAGDKNVAQMAKNGRPQEEIAEKVKLALSRVRHERSTQPVFPPQFLSRIKRIIVFNPLDEAAMIGIAERTVRRMQHLWRRKRDKQVEVSRELIEHIGRRGHDANGRANGEEGGRIVKKLVSDLVESRIQEAAVTDGERYRRTAKVCVGLRKKSDTDSGATSRSNSLVDVSF